MRRVFGVLAGKAARGGNPAGVSAHDFQDEDLCRGLGHRQHIQGRLLRRNGDVLGDGAEAGAVVGDGQVIVDGLRDAEAGHGKAHALADLRHLVRGVHRVVAAVVEEVADVVGFEDLDQAFVFGAVFVDTLELVARGAESAARRVHQGRNGRCAFLAGVDHVFGQCTDDAVASGVDVGDLLRMFARGLDDAAGGGIDDGGNTARLGIKSVHCRHVGFPHVDFF